MLGVSPGGVCPVSALLPRRVVSYTPPSLTLWRIPVREKYSMSGTRFQPYHVKSLARPRGGMFLLHSSLALSARCYTCAASCLASPVIYIRQSLTATFGNSFCKEPGVRTFLHESHGFTVAIHPSPQQYYALFIQFVNVLISTSALHENTYRPSQPTAVLHLALAPAQSRTMPLGLRKGFLSKATGGSCKSLLCKYGVAWRALRRILESTLCH